MGWTVGLKPYTMGHLAHVQDVPGLPRTRDGMDSAIGAVCSETRKHVSGCPLASRDAGMERLEPFPRLGHVQDVPGLPGTLG